MVAMEEVMVIWELSVVGTKEGKMELRRRPKVDHQTGSHSPIQRSLNTCRCWSQTS